MLSFRLPVMYLETGPPVYQILGGPNSLRPRPFLLTESASLLWCAELRSVASYR